MGGARRIFRAAELLCDAVMMYTRHCTVTKTHRTSSTKCEPQDKLDFGGSRCASVGSSVVTNVPFRWGMLASDAGGCGGGGDGECGNSVPSTQVCYGPALTLL